MVCVDVGASRPWSEAKNATAPAESLLDSGVAYCLVCALVEHGLIIDIAVCIVAAWVVAVLSQVLRQPLLLAYLLAGFLIGPHGIRFGEAHTTLISNTESIETISGIGLLLLLFMIGLEIDLKKMASAGRVITVTAAVQILGCVGLGWLFFGLVGPGQGWLEGLYFAVAAAMSSTVIIVKILYDKRELETLPGRVTLGVLVIQDLATILFLAVQPNLKHPALGIMALAVGKVFLLILVGLVVSRYLLPPIFKFVARMPELVLVGSLAWCFAMAGFAYQLGLSREMGALIAGVMVSTFPYTLDVVAKVTSLRDFFVTLFFVGLGMTIPVPTWNYLMWMCVVALFIIGTRMLTVFPPLYWMKQGHRGSLLPAVNLCQMSELSLVLLTLGKASGDVSDTTISIAAFAFAFLAVDSTYAVFKSDTILRKTKPWLLLAGLPDLDGHHLAAHASAEGHAKPKKIFLLGFFWTASSLIEEITREKPALLTEVRVVDFNPHVFERLKARDVDVVYGDIAQRDVLLHAGVAHAEIIICSLPNIILKGASNLKLLRQLREVNATAQIVVHAEQLCDVPELYAAGANYVSTPRLLEAEDLLKVIEAAEKKLLYQMRKEQDHHLWKRNEVIP
ncbi:MAG: cation:proton antiporter [Verrucomicrobia bacterium]|nr:cation:proton antiporter [Verrucomicrobiota bacterium]